MEKQTFFRRVVFPVIIVMGMMILSINAYDLSRSMDNRVYLANVSALMMFMSIWMGALFANTVSYFRGASFGERLLVSLATPVVWSAKVLFDFAGIYSPWEFVFIVFHNLILGCPVVALLCMGLSEIGCRMIHKKRSGEGSVRIFAPANASVLGIGLLLTVLMLWNGGHAYYYRYMDIYTSLFL